MASAKKVRVGRSPKLLVMSVMKLPQAIRFAMGIFQAAWTSRRTRSLLTSAMLMGEKGGAGGALPPGLSRGGSLMALLLIGPSARRGAREGMAARRFVSKRLPPFS